MTLVECIENNLHVAFVCCTGKSVRGKCQSPGDCRGTPQCMCSHNKAHPVNAEHHWTGDDQS